MFPRGFQAPSHRCPGCEDASARGVRAQPGLRGWTAGASGGVAGSRAPAPGSSFGGRRRVTCAGEALSHSSG